MVEESLQLYRIIQNNFPHLSHLSAANDEADMLTGWWREEDWRGDVRYASSVIEAIVLFYQAKKQGKIRLKHISNDNAFLNIPPSYFNQRTLLTRFIINNSNGESHDQFIRKPVMIAMAMAAYLDGFEVQYILKPNYSNLSVLATCNDIKEMESCAVLLTYNSDLKINLTKTYVEVNINLTKHTEISLFIYVLDNNMIHPESVWTQAGKPSMPSANLLRKMRQVEGPHRIYGKKLKNVKRNLKIQLQISMPSIALIHICKRTDKRPKKVKLVHALNITYNEVLLIWKDSKIGTRCVKTYELQFCAGYCKSNSFKRINNEDIILLGYQYVPDIEENMIQETTVGLYRVRVVDYWGRKGIFSNIISYGLSFI
uniref:Uncharacterized protein n=1 Tax=Clastoptera arizonana TaxID=38151 RepID=A0A1B6C221_9HEMI